MTMSNQALSTGQPAPTKNSIQVMAIAPSAGSTVQESTVLTADLAYTVRDFEPGHYLVFAQFDTTTQGTSTVGTFKGYLPVKYANGRYRLCFALANIWKVPDLKRPLSVRFVLNKIDDASHNHSIAVTEPVSFRTD
jgi:hypothetical protein